jgi:membrane fusion protein (multidrug efflux system)
MATRTIRNDRIACTLYLAHSPSTIFLSLTSLFRAFLWLSVVFTACKSEHKDQSAPAASASSAKTQYAVSDLEGFIVKPSVLTERITASGTLIAGENTELHPEASGRVTHIHLPEGQRVSKGTLLLKIFDDDLNTQLRKLETQLRQAEITEQRLGELLKVKGVSQQEYDLAALQVQTLKSEMELLRINLKKTELRAPYDGVLGLRNISPGAYVTPASTVTTIRSAGALKLDFSVPEKYSSLIHRGQTVEFSVEGSAKPYKAVVQATAQSIGTESRNLQVRALVQNAGSLLPGAFATVDLSLGNKAQALMIPNQAIIPQARNKQVIVVRNGKAAFVQVKTGVRQSELIEVTEGVKAGDTVAVTGILFLRPDMPLIFGKIQQ